MMLAGGLWSPFGVGRFSGGLNGIDEILERDQFTLQELLNHDEIIQECKYMNGALIRFLSSRSVIEQLVKYVVAEPPAPINHEENHEEAPEVKYPYIASELFACEVSLMLDVLFDDWSLLDCLFSLLDRPAPLDPAQAGYFRKVVQVLIQRKYQALVEYCAARGIITKLVNHIGLYSVMELLIMLGWDDGLGNNTNKLTEKTGVKY